MAPDKQDTEINSIKRRFQTLPRRRHQPRRAAPSHQMWADPPPPLQPQGPLDTEANGIPHHLKVPKSVPRQTERDSRLPQKPQPSQPARGALCPPTHHLWPGPSSTPSLHQLRAPQQAALLQAPTFHSTAQHEGTRGLGLSRARTNTRGSSVFRRTRVPHSDSPRLAVYLSPALAEQKTGSAGGGRPAPSPGLLTGDRDLAPGLCPQPSTQGGPGPQPT